MRVIALGNAMASDDGAALAAAARLHADKTPGLDIRLAGRPGPGLLDLLDPTIPTLILDVVRRGAAPGELIRIPLDQLAQAAAVDGALSSHGLGLGQAMQLAEQLGRPLPPGLFLGIGGERFSPGTALSPRVQAGLHAWCAAARAALEALERAAGEPDRDR